MTIKLADNYIFPVQTRARILHSSIWDTGGTATASSTAEGAFEVAPTYSTTFQYWEPETTGAETWTYTLSEATDCTCIGLVIKDVASLKVEYNNGSWVEIYDDTPPNNSPFMAFFSASDVVGFRITITGGGKLFTARIGEALVMPQSIYGGHAPIDLARNVQTVSNMSSDGSAFLGRTTINGNLQSSFAWTNLGPKWARETWYPFIKAAESDPFFIAWRPDYGSAQGNEAAYIIEAQQTNPNNIGVGKGLMAVGFSGTASIWE